MSISEIESILQSLRLRHPELDAKMLETLLLAGGWEASIMRDTMALYKTGKSSVPVLQSSQNIPSLKTEEIVKTIPVETKEHTQENESLVVSIVPEHSQVTEEIISPSAEKNTVTDTVPPLIASSSPSDFVYVTSDGHEENVLEVFPEDSEGVLEEENSEQSPLKITHSETENQPIAEIKQVSDEVIPVTTGKIKEEIAYQEPESLIVPSPVASRVIEMELPENLPLKPFESTPHVWPFSRYKDVFYGEVMPPASSEESHLKEKHLTEHFNVERTALDKKDESLVFLAGSMLVVIIVILGYMYSNGRL